MARSEQEVAKRLSQSWRDSLFTCGFIFLAGWASAVGPPSLWLITIPAAVGIAVLEAGLMRYRLEALITAQRRMEEVGALIEEAEGGR